MRSGRVARVSTGVPVRTSGNERRFLTWADGDAGLTDDLLTRKRPGAFNLAHTGIRLHPGQLASWG